MNNTNIVEFANLSSSHKTILWDIYSAKQPMLIADVLLPPMLQAGFVTENGKDRYQKTELLVDVIHAILDTEEWSPSIRERRDKVFAYRQAVA